MTYPNTPYPGGNEDNNFGAAHNGDNGFGTPNPFGPGFGETHVPMQKPNNYLVWTILSTILCCVPIGAVSIYFATRVDTYWNQGLFDKSIDASNKAKLWAIIAAIVGIVFSVISVAVTFSNTGTGVA